MKTIWTFLVSFENNWNPNTNKYSTKIIEVAMSTEAKAETVRAEMIMEGYACTPITHLDAFTDESMALAYAKEMMNA